MKECHIISLITVQDFKGLECLIDEYAPSINKTLYRILNETCEQSYHGDVMNDILYTIWKKITTYDAARSSFGTWILLITRSKAIEYKRKIYKTASPLGELSEELFAKESLVLEKENFLSLIDTLSEKDQLIFLYFYFYQFSPEEIADSLEMSTSSIYSRLSRGRTKLSTTLGGV